MDAKESDPQTYAIIGAAMAVHTELGAGFLESVYQEAMKIELELRQIPARDQVKLLIRYRDRPLETFFKSDFICYESVIVEIKAQTELTAIDEAQLLNYLKATRHSRGLLFNFGKSSLQYRRMICTSESV